MDRGSKFLAYAIPIKNELEASDVLQKIKKEHPKARHFCTALRLFPDASLERSVDGGEPSGSAGKPILGQLIKNNITNVIIIVVRYFGGTKLGIPGLIEAYKTSAANAILAGAIVKRKVYAMVGISMSYETISPFLNFCKQLKIPVREETYGERASLIICFSKSTVEGDLLRLLGKYTQMDYQNLEDYITHLGITIEFLPDDLII